MRALNGCEEDAPAPTMVLGTTRIHRCPVRLLESAPWVYRVLRAYPHWLRSQVGQVLRGRLTGAGEQALSYVAHLADRKAEEERKAANGGH